MGSLSIDTQKKEREYGDVTLSDKDVVKYLILYRSKVDVVYNATKNVNLDKAGDVFDFNQELIALYASLDVLIEKCSFKDKQLMLLKLIFEGNTVPDICNMDIGYTKSATYRLLDSMISRILQTNHKMWIKSMKTQGYIN